MAKSRSHQTILSTVSILTFTLALNQNIRRQRSSSFFPLQTRRGLSEREIRKLTDPDQFAPILGPESQLGVLHNVHWYRRTKSRALRKTISWEKSMVKGTSSFQPTKAVEDQIMRVAKCDFSKSEIKKPGSLVSAGVSNRILTQCLNCAIEKYPGKKNRKGKFFQDCRLLSLIYS